MAKLTLTDQTTGYQTANAYNANNSLIEAAFENTLSRDGTAPNEMGASLDMNSYNVNNVANLSLQSLTINGVPYLPPGGVGVTTLAALSDVTDATPTIGNVLFGDGVGWFSTPLSVVASNIAVRDEGNLVSANITTLNIVGADVIATNPTPGTVDLTFTDPNPLVYGGLIGSIQEWPLAIAPADHVECDGSFYDPVLYPEVFAVIGYQFGQMGSFFAVPDLRGYFIRGWDHGAGVDGDAASRTDRGDGTTGDNVGTEQDQAVGPHGHTFTAQQNIGGFTDNGGAPDQRSVAASRTTLETGTNIGTDTRPKNKYMMYIIRMNASAGFGNTPAPTTIIGAGVGVEYIGTGDGIQTSFGFADLLPADFSYAGVAIYLDGVRQSSSNYTASDGFNVVFNTAPANAVEIIIIANGDQVAPNPVGWTLDTNDPMVGTPVNGMATGVVNAINYWVIIGNSGRIFTSDDEGATWVQQAVAQTAENLLSIIYSSAQERFLIGGSNGQLMYSAVADITTWTEPTDVGLTGDVVAVEYFPSGSGFNMAEDFGGGSKWQMDAVTEVVGGETSGVGIPNGGRWLYSDDGPDTSLYLGVGVAWREYISLGDPSPNDEVGNISMQFNCIATTQRLAARSAIIGGPTGQLRTYEAAVQQALHDQAATGGFVELAYSSTSTRFVGVTDAGEIVYLDTDATSWTTNDSEVLVTHAFDNSAFTDLTWDAVADKYIAVNASGQIGWSADGIT